MKDKKKKLLWCDRLRVVFLVGFILAAMLAWSGSAFCLVLMFVMLASFFAVEFTMNRCPHCDGYLDRNRSQFCQHCGRPIREEKPDT